MPEPAIEPEEVLRFWFEETPPEARFSRNAAFDAEVGRRFGLLHAALAHAFPEHWLQTPEGLLAGIIVYDQFSRNLHRGDPRAFKNDTDALNLAHLMIERGWDIELGAAERQFAYMPFMHCEDARAQARSVELFGTLGNEEASRFALLHQDAIERFGRFPGRNEALGRETTPAERDWLDKHGEF